MDQYDLSNGSPWYFVRFNTIVQADQCDLSNGSLRYLVQFNTVFQADQYDLFRRIHTAFRTNHYDLSGRSIRPLIRITTIFGMDQCNLPGGSIQSLVRINTMTVIYYFLSFSGEMTWTICNICSVYGCVVLNIILTSTSRKQFLVPLRCCGPYTTGHTWSPF
jgi:hypothetical protein